MKSILVIGGGSIGERHLRCFLKTNRVTVSLCEIREPIRERIRQEYGVNVYDDLSNALENEVDAAVICTPAHLHVSMAMQIAKRGTPLLIEKPLSTTIQNTDELISIINERSLAASVAYVYRQHPALQAMKAAIASDEFGRPVQLVAVSGQHFPLYRPAYREIYYTRHETGGGAIQDALTHMLNAGEWLVGPISRLVADAQHCILEGVEVEDTVHLITRHGDVMGNFSLNQHQPPNETTLTVVCEKGAVRFEAHNVRWLSCTELGGPWKVEEQFQLERDDLFVAQANSFLDQLDGLSPAACTLEEGRQTLKVNLAALESVRTQQWVSL